jgi:hypothetical protein
MTTKHADAMEFTVTTKAAANGRAGVCSNLVVRPDWCNSPTLALQFTDGENHAGRSVAVPIDALRDSLGYVPDIAYVTHESGETYSVPVEHSGNLAKFDLREFSTNTVTFNGEVNIGGSPASDGAQYQYELSNDQSVGNFTVDVTGNPNREWSNESSASLENGDSLPVDIGGNAAPEGPSANGEPVVSFAGSRAYLADSASGSGATDGSTATVSVAGDGPPQNQQVTFTGVESTGSRYTPTGTGDATIDVNGNVDPSGPSANGEPTIDLTGREDAVADSDTATDVAARTTKSVSIGGNLDPSGPETTVTAYEVARTTFGTRSTDHTLFGADHSTEVLIDNPPENINQLSYTIGNYNDQGDNPSADIYIVCGDSTNNNYGEGTLVKSGHTTTPSTGTRTLSLDTTFDTSGCSQVTVEFVSSGDNSWVEAEHDENAVSSTYFTLSGSDYNMATNVVVESVPDNVKISDNTGTTTTFGDMSEGQTTTKAFGATLSTSEVTIDADGGRFDWSLDYTERTGTKDPSVNVDGDATDASYSGVLASGETVTREIASLSSGSVTVDTSTDAGPLPSWSITYDEQITTENPSVDIDGDGTPDASYSGIIRSGESETANASGLSLGDNPVSFGAASGSEFDWALNYDRVEYTESPEIDHNGDGIADASVSGEISPGETVIREVSGVSTDTGYLNVTTANSTNVGIELQVREVTRTVDPTITVNGHVTDYTGTLGDGDTVSLTTNESWIQNGTNNVSVSVSPSVSSGPTGLVGLDYSHEADTNQSVDYVGETWSERYNISRTFAGDRDSVNLTVPFQGSVVSARDVEIRRDGGTWSGLSAENRSFDQTTLIASVGSVSAGETIEVRVNGSKVVTHNGSIQVLSPTVDGNTLNTEFEVESRSDGFYIDVSGTSENNWVHYLANESWSTPDEWAVIESEGNQRLTMPGAPAGGTASARTIPLEANPQTDVRIQVASPGQSPEFVVDPGGVSGDSVEYVWHDTTSGETYGLVSRTRDGYVIDKDTAESPVFLVDSDDDSESLLIESIESSGGSSGGAGTGGGGSAPLSSSGGPLASPYLLMGAASLVILGGGWAARRSSVPTWAGLALVTIVGVVAVEALAPGTLSGAAAYTVAQIGAGLSSGLSTVSPALLLGGGAIGLWGVYRLIKKYTRRENVVLQVDNQ